MKQLLLIIAALFLFSCGDDAVEPEEFVPREEIPDRCSGCLDVDTCVDGTSDTACGSNGMQCNECDDGESCQGGQCVSPDACQDDCDGCCDSDGVCLQGGTVDACGDGGNACSDCGAGTCEDGECVQLICDVDNCLGCCLPDGSCETGDLDNSCGTGAVTCNDCASIQNICVQGICMVDANSCSQTCAGCCDGETCVETISEAECGAGGNACVACNQGDFCSNGVCGPVMQADRYDILIISSVVSQTKPDGRDWDTLDFEPDLFVVAGAIDAMDNVFFDLTTGTRSEFNTVWNVTLFMDAPIEALNNLFQIELWDQDTFSEDDVVCFFNPPITPAVLSGAQQESICADDPATSIRWQLIPK